ncbi:MAG: hypothetical protein VKS61_14735 [Candidatus Sericytochromatia bacterium]|nr:hypothetical protein [Candidatus Sericytochromatia bacterium]
MPALIRALLAAAVLAGLAAPALAEEAGPPPEYNWVPEPMLFDLIRSLGAKAGEREVGVGLHRRADELELGTEVELMVADGHGLELELVNPQGESRGVRGVYQATLGRLLDGRVLHGPHLVGAYAPGLSRTEASAVYVVTARLSPQWTLLAMAGGRLDHGAAPAAEGAEAAPGAAELTRGAVLNASLFRDLSDSFIVGLEGTWEQRPTGLGELELMPQLRWDLDEGLHVQAGLGLTSEAGVTRPMSSLRVSHAF